MLRALIVDDEELARERVREMLRGESDVEIVAECDGGEQAVAAIREKRPDLVFLDVQMPELDGFGVLDRLDESELPRVIFVTAYDQHALRAFDAHALDYLLKPFREERFRDAVQRARESIGQGREDVKQSLRELLSELRGEEAVEHLVVRSPGKIRFVPVADVDWVESAGNYVMVHVGSESHLMRETMSELDARLDSRRFVRTHRTAIVAIARIREVKISTAGDGRVFLENDQVVPLSRRFRKRFDEALAS